MMLDKKDIKKILLIRFSCIGDVLLTTPVVATVRKRFPKAHITYLTEKAASETLKHNPDIDRVLIFEKGIAENIAMEKPYNLVINFDWFRSSQALCFLSRAEYRIGFPAAEKSVYKLEACNAYNIKPIKLLKKPDIICQFLNLTRSLGLKDYTKDTGFYLTDQEKSFAASYMKKHKLYGNLIIGIHPGGRREKELWPAKKFAELSDEVIKKLSATVLIFQGPGEEGSVKDMYSRVKQKHKAFIMPEVPLRKYASLVNNCDIFIAHDRGPMHIAISLGVKTIGIFTAPEAKEWFPYRQKKDCDYLEKKSAKLVKVNEVFEKIITVLSKDIK